MQLDLDNIQAWGERWSVNFNPEKTKSLLISRHTDPTNVQLTFNATPVKQVTYHKHLGLTFNCTPNWSNHLDEIISKANKRLGIIRNLKYTLSRDTLKILYVTYVRSILEYADCVWDDIPDYQTKRLEKININAIRCITGLNVSAHKSDLYKESGLQPLKTRRKFHRLTLMYKIINRQAPDYLADLLPPRVGERNPYPVRDDSLFTNYRARTEQFRNSYYPKTIRDWNALPSNVRFAPSVASFKFQLSKLPEFRITKPPAWYLHGSRKENIILAQIRNHCSGLSLDLHQNHVLAHPTCQNCNRNVRESCHHYFLHCPKYHTQRQVLTRSFGIIDTTLTTDTILHGNIDENYDFNKLIVNAVQKFIKETKRFN